MEDSGSKELIEIFSTDFWLNCDCVSYCYSKVPVDKAYETYREFRNKNKVDKVKDVETLLKNFKIQNTQSLQEQKLVFKYIFSGEKI